MDPTPTDSNPELLAAADDRARTDLDDVIDALGFDHTQLEADLDDDSPKL